ncbi:MAG: hypothetical protein CVU06_09505, partial [Bacteroidetes bacterium HGW-Bacteroidetes-22]
RRIFFFCFFFLPVLVMGGEVSSEQGKDRLSGSECILLPELMQIGEKLVSSKKNGDLYQMTMARFELAGYYARNQRWSIVNQLVKKSIKVARYLGDYSLTSDFMLLAAKVDLFSGNTSGSERTLELLINKGVRERDPGRQAQAMIALASVYQRRSDGGLAWPLLREAAHITSESNLKREHATILHQMGIISRDMGDIALAARSLTESSSLFGQEGDKKNQAMVNIALGAILSEAGLYKAALGYDNQAVELYRKLPVSVHQQRLLGYALNAVGMSQSFLGNVEAARQGYLEAFQTWAKIGDVKNQVFAVDNMANIAIAKGKMDEAEGLLATAFRLNGNLSKDIQSAVLLHTKSKYHEAIHQTDSAVIFARAAGERFLSIGVLSLALEAYEDLAKYLRLGGNLQEAILALDQWKMISDSLNKGLTATAIAALQIEYDVRLGKETINYLNQEMVLQAKLLDRKTNYLVTVGIAFFLILILAVMLGIQVRRRDQAYAVLLQKNLEIMEINKPSIGVPSSGSLGSGVAGKHAGEPQKVIVDAQGIMRRLQKAMEAEKIYRDSNMTLPGLAQHLGTNTSYLSRLINVEYQTNFNAFINAYRVREACRLLQDGAADSRTLEALGQQVGFNSRASFHTAFKRVTGLTPGIFVDQIRHK